MDRNALRGGLWDGSNRDGGASRGGVRAFFAAFFATLALAPGIAGFFPFNLFVNRE